MSYMYRHTVEERGYVEAKNLTHDELKKYVFVTDSLNETLRKSNCGWENLQYKVMETSSGVRTEFLILWSGEINNSGSRWINVSGNSLASVMCEMCKNLW